MEAGDLASPFRRPLLARLAHYSRPDEGPLTEPTAAAQPPSPEPLNLPPKLPLRALLGDRLDRTESGP